MNERATDATVHAESTCVRTYACLHVRTPSFARPIQRRTRKLAPPVAREERARGSSRCSHTCVTGFSARTPDIVRHQGTETGLPSLDLRQPTANPHRVPSLATESPVDGSTLGGRDLSWKRHPRPRNGASDVEHTRHAHRRAAARARCAYATHFFTHGVIEGAGAPVRSLVLSLARPFVFSLRQRTIVHSAGVTRAADGTRRKGACLSLVLLRRRAKRVVRRARAREVDAMEK